MPAVLARSVFCCKIFRCAHKQGLDATFLTTIIPSRKLTRANR